MLKSWKFKELGDEFQVHLSSTKALKHTSSLQTLPVWWDFLSAKSFIQRDNSDFEAKKNVNESLKRFGQTWKFSLPIWQKGLLVSKMENFVLVYFKTLKRPLLTDTFKFLKKNFKLFKLIFWFMSDGWPKDTAKFLTKSEKNLLWKRKNFKLS